MVLVGAQKKADRWFLIYLVIWLVFGLMALASASAPVGYDKFHDTYYFLKKQIFNGLIPGVAAFLVLARVNYQTWKKFSWLFYGFCLFLLALVFVPGVGLFINGSKSWINIFGHGFQPSELAKLGVIVMLSYLLVSNKNVLHDWQKGLLPVLAIIAPAVFLILVQPDIGTLSILVVIIFALLYLAKVPKPYLVAMGAAAVAVLIGLIIVAPYRAQRITTFLHPELDPQGVGYHINQAFLAVGSGGFWGLGWGNSRQKFQYLPEVSADSIYAVIAEETGFIFAGGLVVLILLFGWRGLKIAKAAPDDFGHLLVTGIVVWLVWQSFLNIGAMVGIFPLTGVPLPFVSHGGSALVTALAAAGVVANVSRQS